MRDRKKRFNRIDPSLNGPLSVTYEPAPELTWSQQAYSDRLMEIISKKGGLVASRWMRMFPPPEY